MNATATTVNFAGAASTLSIGAASGTTNMNSDVIIKNKTFKVVDATPNDKFVVANTGATTINFNTTTTPSASAAGIVSNASLYVYNSGTATNNHSTIVNQIYGTDLTNKVVYSLGVGSTATLTGWSIYRYGNNNDIRFNNTWNATAGVNNANDKLVILNNGNVGIGTNDPSTYNLFIYRASNANNLIRIATDGTTTNAIAGVMMTKSNSDTTGFSMRYDRTDDKLYFATQDGTPAYTNRVTIQNDGNVGIGAGAPRGKLDIYNGNVVVRTTGEGASAAIYLATPHDTNNSAMKCAIIAEGISTFSRSKLHFCLDDTADNTTTYNASVSNARMTIIPSGNVGIGKTDPEHKLHVEGTVKITGATETAPTTYTVNIGGNLGVSKDISAFASDIRLKNVISKINNPLNIVNKLSGFYYKFNEIAQEYNLDPDNKTHVGVSAQDVQSVLPEIVEMAPFDSSNLPCGERVSRSGQNYLTIKYDKLTPVLIEAVKELQNQIETQNNIINNQNTIITEMKDSIEYLKKEIDTLKQSS